MQTLLRLELNRDTLQEMICSKLMCCLEPIEITGTKSSDRNDLCYAFKKMYTSTNDTFVSGLEFSVSFPDGGIQPVTVKRKRGLSSVVDLSASFS
ncbi:hypothetical protein TNCV_2008971 [Trichonephila clavipes]|nr:hypothetical protein TNCV_2008971 [Trichonephila clavipes]